ncbi:hypothetical protein H5410_060774 [Solanum commersonii]|uniref:DUF4283 domain-containing protein n=1 Tax=Solanum commersonii TaxID=4109 RepID=A0A9J5W738_SOLCO|nr:hypothetical protein H5410_060774 [Solanum commersonii]
MEMYAPKIWHFINVPKVLLHGMGYYIFKFHSKKDKERVINYGPYYFNNIPFILKPWELDFMFDKQILSLVHRWVKFPELPVGYWPVKALSKIASVVGHPMHTDYLTTNTDKPRYCNECLRYGHNYSDCGYRNRPRKVVLLRLLAPRPDADVPRTKKRKTRKAQPPKMVWHVVV